MIPGRKIAATEVVFTDWITRGGDNVIVRAQAIDRSETGTLGVDIELYTKNQEKKVTDLLSRPATATL